MTGVEKRMANLSARASHEAWLQIQRLRHHPKFEKLLAQLEKVDGTLRGPDVEKAARRFLDGHEDRN